MLGSDKMFADAADKLKETVRLGLTFDTAQVKVIGLEDIKQEAGAHWPAIADRIRANSMNFLEACLENGDMVIPCGDGFLVIYAHAEGRDLARECATMQDTLNSFYLGSEGMEHLQTRVQGRRMPAQQMAQMLAPNTSAPPQPAPRRALEVVFLPSWSAARQAVGIYLATPRSADHGIGYSGTYRETGQHDEDDFAATDSALLNRVRAEIERSDPNCLVSYAVHATTLQHRERRRAFLAQLAAIPESTRKYMLARIAEIPHGTPVVTLADWVHRIRPFTPRVAIELHHSERSIGGFDGVGAWSVGCCLPDNVQSMEFRARNSAAIKRWRAQAHRQGLKVGFANLNDPVLIDTACSEGVDLIASERIWPALSETAGVKPFSTIVLRRALAQMGALGQRAMPKPATAYEARATA